MYYKDSGIGIVIYILYTRYDKKIINVFIFILLK